MQAMRPSGNKLCKSIIASQQPEIDQMKAALSRLQAR